MLESLRNSTKSWPIKILFALLVLSFGVWGIGDMVSAFNAPPPAITVGDTEIPADAVMAEFKRDVERLQPMFGGNLDAETGRRLGLLDRTIQQLTARAVLDETARGLGLRVNDQELRDRIASEPAFQNKDGQFDPDIFRSVLMRSNLSEQDLLAMERANMVRAQLADTVTDGAAVPNSMLDPLFRHRKEQRIAQMVTIQTDQLAAPKAPADTVLEEFYSNNLSRFMAPEYRAVTAILIRPSDVADEASITDDMVAEAYESRMGSFQTPERRNVQQVLLDDAAEAEKAAAMMRDGKDLRDIARSVGDKPKEIGNLGWLAKTDLPAQVNDAVFALTPETVSEPVSSPFGWHVFKVTGVQPQKTRPLDDVRAQLVQDLARERALDEIFQVANQVEDSLGGGADLAATAANLNLKLVQAPAIDAQGRNPSGEAVADLPQSEAFLNEIFATPEGMESPMTDLETGGYFLLRVNSITPARPKPFAEVKADVVTAWQDQQKDQAARILADEMAAELRGGKSLQAVADSHKLKIITTRPFTRSETAGDLPATAVAAMFQASPGGVAVASTPGGAVVARLDKVIAADPQADKAALETMRDQTARNVASDLLDQYLGARQAALGAVIRPNVIDQRFAP